MPIDPSSIPQTSRPPTIADPAGLRAAIEAKALREEAGYLRWWRRFI